MFYTMTDGEAVICTSSESKVLAFAKRAESRGKMVEVLYAGKSMPIAKKMAKQAKIEIIKARR